MTDTRLDVLCIGNAIVDVIAVADEGFLVAEGLDKGSMRLIDADEATRLYGKMGPGREISGGSAGNTAAGIAMLGARAGFVGQVANDQLGEVYAHDIRSIGVEFTTPFRDSGDVPTARCLILVTPDAQRTMNTFLGAAQHLDTARLDEAQVKDAAILYLEGYLWDPETPRAAMERAIEVAHAAGRRVAFTLSDSFCVDRHRDGFLKLIDDKKVDILFANEAEIISLSGSDDFDAAIASIAPRVPLLVVTRSEKGAVAVQNGQRVDVPAEPVAQIVDTTGAGDLFAAGFLTGIAQHRSLEDSLRIGAIAAAEVISLYGARPEADLKAMVAQKLG
ncbi:adenosine kinase [Sphingosinicella sp. BN140058]|uniref:adenosine kinase n=1 Tax=Sphingosinicella sp. BN140058 TaxID=1892855 RepID=UPI001010D3FE|nr:adenosine kinase [Sphingosinicella sp. BN140058]QAY77322.1 adenosine kinase [Sphingosinicella sp. BN140058]